MRAMINGSTCRLEDVERLVQGSVGAYELNVLIGESWSGLTVTAVFASESEGTVIDVIVTGQSIQVPHELLETANEEVYISFDGRTQDGTLVRRTKTVLLGKVFPSLKPQGIPSSEPTPSWATQVQATAAEALNAALNIREAAERGDFDGVSPTVTITDIAGGHRVTITDAAHPGGQSFDVMDGAGGEAGAVQSVNYTISTAYSITCDKTFAQITAAAQSGTPIVVAASGLGIAGQTSNVYASGTTISSVLRYDVGEVHQYIIIEHNAQDVISLTIRPDIEVDQQLDGTSGNAISNAAVVTALNALPAVPGLSDTPPLIGDTPDAGVSVEAARADHVHPMPSSLQVGAIPAPASASIGDFLCFTDNGWAAVTVPSAAGVSF